MRACSTYEQVRAQRVLGLIGCNQSQSEPTFQEYKCPGPAPEVLNESVNKSEACTCYVVLAWSF